MTEKQLHKLKKQPSSEATADYSLQNKRRRLLKGTMAIPVILTLHSGAALARSSNLVGAVTKKSDAAKIDGNIICVRPGDFDSTADLSGVPADIGETPYATYNSSLTKVKMRDGQPVLDANNNEIMVPDRKAQKADCLSKPGIMVSATAWTSIATVTGVPNDTTI